MREIRSFPSPYYGPTKTWNVSGLTAAPHVTQVCHMETASSWQMRHDFSTALEWIDAGEHVEISKRGKFVALLSPPPPVKAPRSRERPDFAARLKL